MTLHPRLQQPTLESPVRRGHGFAMVVALTVLAAGFAYAMPGVVPTNGEEDAQAEFVVGPTGSTDTSTATTPKPKKNDGEERENHGAAVSTAAHCDLDGKAHGEFVRSVAHDKDATVAEVEAACTAAQAAAATAEDTDDVTHGRGHAKAKVKLDGGGAAGDDDDGDDDGSDDSEDEAGSAAEDDDAGKAGPPDHAQAKDK